MADDTKKGPVKPPIIDAKPTPKAQSATSSSPSPAQKPAPANTTSKKPDTQTKPSAETPFVKAAKTEKPKSGLSVGKLAIATLLGAGLGTGATSFMAFNNIPPFEKGTTTSQFNAAMETMQKRVFDLENAPKIDVSGFATTDQMSGLASGDALATLQAQINTMANKIGALDKAVSTNAQNAPSNETPLIDPAVITQIQTEIATLKASILELSPDSALALDAQLEQNQKLAAALAQIQTLETDQASNKAALFELDQQLNQLSQTLADLDTKVSAAPDQLSSAANLPLLLDAWESALHAGMPYADYALGAATILPELNQSPVLLSNAQTGVATPASLQADFATLIPAFVKSDADLPQNASWLDQLAAQAKSAIGLRPLDQTGQQPLAIVARIEAALAAKDLENAQIAFAQLPQDWQDMSNEFADQLKATNAANAQLDQAKQMALNLATQTQGATQ